ncbi:MAG TPA: hypothetical protein PL009_10060 [Flavipsychrobacter sp.]|nr:hypothetical protein [Flavipsychrobacter sp.]
MKNIITLFAAIIAISSSASGQVNSSNASSTAQQNVQLALSNAIEVTFTNNNSANGSTVSLAFNTADHYANGVESGEQELKVRSNKNFKIGAKIDLTNFSYVGNGNISNIVTPSDAFALKIVSNTTGGNTVSAFTNYGNLTTNNQDVILNGVNGNNQKFSVKYKCNPGWGLPAGTYTFAVVYTATQQ